MENDQSDILLHSDKVETIHLSQVSNLFQIPLTPITKFWLRAQAYLITPSKLPYAFFIIPAKVVLFALLYSVTPFLVLAQFFYSAFIGRPHYVSMFFQ